MKLKCNGLRVSGTLGAATAALFLATLTSYLAEGGRVRHCYTCLSRGPLGDCRDPFSYNETTAEGVRGVQVTPCASAWCAKIIDGRDDDFDVATERMCLQRPPDDQEERCADTVYRNRLVYMCICRGDFCNTAVSIAASHPVLLIAGTLAVTLTLRCSA